MEKTLKTLITLSALGTFSTFSQAQSSVTLYGVIDVGINYVNNAGGHSQYNMTSGIVQGSRWGLQGSEDLGGGLKAIFKLENGFNVNTGTLGQGGLEFGRRAYVGLSSTRFGTVTFGRQYDSMIDYVAPLSSMQQWAGGTAAHAGDVDNMANNNRVNNSIKYASTNYGGLTFGGLYSLGGIAGAPGRNQIYSLGAGYTNGPLTLDVAYVNVRDPNLSYFAGNPGALTATGSNMPSPAYSGYASATTQQILGAGGAYQFGKGTLGLIYNYVLFSGLGNTSVGPNKLPGGRLVSGSGKFNSVEVNYKYLLTPFIQLGAEYSFTKEDGIGDAKYHLFTLGVDYFLSKRTDIYLIGTTALASGTNSLGQRAVPVINSLTPPKSNQQTYVRVALRHTF
jgi:predicted porin